MFRSRGLFITLLAAALLGALTTTASTQHIARGVLFNLGENLDTELTPSGDVDTFVFYGVAGVSASFTLQPLSSGFSPTLTMLDRDGDVVSLAAYTKAKGATTKVQGFPVPGTGPYFLRVTDPQGRTGHYRLKTKGDLAAAPPYPKTTLGPGETQDFVFGAGPGLIVDTKITFADHRNPVSVLRVLDPDGEEIPHGAGSFYKTRKGLLSSLLIRSSARSSWRDDADRRRLGPYTLEIGGAASPTTFKVKMKVNHVQGRGTRVVASSLPVITSLEPPFGRPGTDIVVHGSNFLPGKVEVLFGDTYGREPAYLSSTAIAVRAPFGEGEVDITVINPDGQEGVLEDAFIFIPNPPNIDVVTPSEGPDSGGTVVDVFGDHMTYVEKVTLGTTVLAGSPTVISVSQIRFTTEPLAPGTYTIVLTDRFGQTDSVPDAFALVAAPVLLSIAPEKSGVGRTITCLGQNFRPDHLVLLDGAPTATTYVNSTNLRWVTPPGTVGDKLIVGVQDIWGRTSTLSKPYEYAWSQGLVEETFDDGTHEDTAFTPTTGGLAAWNPKTDPGKLISTFGSVTTSVPYPTSKSVSSNVFPFNTSSMYVVKWYNSNDCGSAGTVTGFSFITGTSVSPGAVFSSFTVLMGHNKSSTGLTTSSPRTANFSDTPVTVINGVSYTLPSSISATSPVAYPTFSKTFSYNGTDHIVVDTSQAGGSKSQTWGVYSGYGKETHRVWGYPNNGTTSSGSTTSYYYQCVLDFRSDTSMAQSLWYRTESNTPDFLDPIVTPTSQPSGTTVLLEYQGAKEGTGGTPDPLTFTSWTQNPADLIDHRYLRFRVTFTANLDSGDGPALDRIVVPYLFFD